MDNSTPNKLPQLIGTIVLAVLLALLIPWGRIGSLMEPIETNAAGPTEAERRMEIERQEAIDAELERYMAYRPATDRDCSEPPGEGDLLEVTLIGTLADGTYRGTWNGEGWDIAFTDRAKTTIECQQTEDGLWWQIFGSGRCPIGSRCDGSPPLTLRPASDCENFDLGFGGSAVVIDWFREAP